MNEEVSQSVGQLFGWSLSRTDVWTNVMEEGMKIDGQQHAVGLTN